MRQGLVSIRLQGGHVQRRACRCKGLLFVGRERDAELRPAHQGELCKRAQGGKHVKRSSSYPGRHRLFGRLLDEDGWKVLQLKKKGK